jgi:hypothetical protein
MLSLDSLDICWITWWDHLNGSLLAVKVQLWNLVKSLVLILISFETLRFLINILR